jgi:hypothetical protein
MDSVRRTNGIDTELGVCPLRKDFTMILMTCTYPDGETSEARYRLTMDLALALYCSWPDTDECAQALLVWGVL